MNKVILASASPRRRELLKCIFNEFEVIPADVDETVSGDIPALLRPEHIAAKKAAAVAKNFPDALVIGSDTAVFIGDKMLGKPKNRADARNMLLALSGRVHKVVTGCSICLNGRSESFSAVTEVEFYELSDEELESYLDTDDWTDKAGAYGIQSKAVLLVKGINGDYNNVVGLPCAELNRRLKKFIKP